MNVQTKSWAVYLDCVEIAKKEYAQYRRTNPVNFKNLWKYKAL